MTEDLAGHKGIDLFSKLHEKRVVIFKVEICLYKFFGILKLHKTSERAL